MFLRHLDGGHKVESEVRQITAEVNKFLKFACPKGKDLMWVDLLNEHGHCCGKVETLQSVVAGALH